MIGETDSIYVPQRTDPKINTLHTGIQTATAAGQQTANTTLDKIIGFLENKYLYFYQNENFYCQNGKYFI